MSPQGPSVAAALAFVAAAEQQQQQQQQQQQPQLLLLLSDFSLLLLQKGLGVSWLREEGLSLLTTAAVGALPSVQENGKP